MRYRIYDMDGTIVDSSHRYRTRTDKHGNKVIDLNHWRENERKIMDDKLLPLARQYKQDLTNPDITVIIATARACKKGDDNYRFIEKYLGMPDYFIHRGINDNRKGADIKIAGCKKVIPKNAIVEFFEDNIDYLINVCYALNAEPIYIPSKQGY